MDSWCKKNRYISCEIQVKNVHMLSLLSLFSHEIDMNFVQILLEDIFSVRILREDILPVLRCRPFKSCRIEYCLYDTTFVCSY